MTALPAAVPGALAPASDEVHLWCVSLDAPPETSARLYPTLSPDEQNRTARLRFARDRHRFVVARGTLRALLGRYLESRPGQVRFTYNAFGKPDLGPEFGSRLKFNLSHSADLALIAVTAEASIGVDVEFIQPQRHYVEIARSVFSTTEVDQLNRLPSHLYPQAFLGRWTQKEAYVKARGDGLAAELLTSCPPLPSLRSGQAPYGRGGTWSVYTLRPAPGYVGAVAVEGRERRLRQWRW